MTRFVVAGCLSTKSALPATIQQKYCDHGRSTSLLTTVWPIFLARSISGSGIAASTASTVLSMKDLDRVGALDPVDVVGRVEPDIVGHEAHEDLRV